VHVTYHPLCAADCAQSGSVIGQALGDLKLYLLDTNGLPVATGEPGELYVGGAGVARGYLNRPELTAERFLRDPFDPSGEGRLYRSGDLARTLPDGNLLYLGRNDQQIKLRGFRIEPGEIAACLLRHPSVREAAVVAREDLPDGKQLIAYVVGRQVGNATFDHHGIRAYLRTQLPDYMVPAAIVQVAALPLNLNGKLDSKALLAPDRDAYAHAVFEAPREGTEQSLAAIWQELLGIERVSRHDHLFDLGGNSLLATRLLGRLSAAHSIAPSFSALYDHPSLKEQGEWLDTRAVHDQVHNTRLIKPASQTERPLLSFAQQRMWLLSQLKESSAAVPHSFGTASLWIPGSRRVATGAPGLACATRRITHSISSIEEEVSAQLLSAEAELPYAEHDLRDHPNPHSFLIDILANERHAAFDFAVGPLVRALMIRVADQEHVLALTLHHIVFDGWSTDILLREWHALYRAFARQHPDPLPLLPIQYSNYTAWQCSRQRNFYFHGSNPL
jgi:hypothetical protein